MASDTIPKECRSKAVAVSNDWGCRSPGTPFLEAEISERQSQKYCQPGVNLEWWVTQVEIVKTFEF